MVDTVNCLDFQLKQGRGHLILNLETIFEPWIMPPLNFPREEAESSFFLLITLAGGFASHLDSSKVSVLRGGKHFLSLVFKGLQLRVTGLTENLGLL